MLRVEYREIMKTRIDSPNHTDNDAAARAWALLGHATRTSASPGFADRVAAAAHGLPISRPGPMFRWLRIGIPLAAAAAVVLALAPLLFDPVSPATGNPSSQASADFASLARLEAAIDLLPEDAEVADIDPAMLDLASIDDPAKIPEDQLLGLLY